MTRKILFTLLTLWGAPSHANLILTEIHYNGPTAGTDPDEFLELANTGVEALDLDGYGFSRGINFTFAEGSTINPSDVWVIARDPQQFRNAFTDFTGQLFDYGGSLSNSGETIALLNDGGDTLWSITYDDGGEWPASADGAGDSLQLRELVGAPDQASSWFAAAPTPGVWEGINDNPTLSPRELPSPGPLLLLASGLFLMGRTRGAGPGIVKQLDPGHSP